MNRSLRLAFVAAAIASISACGGGGDSDDASVTPPSPAPTPAPPTTTPLSVKVIDGIVQNALVCLDANKNTACDSGELQGRTGNTGEVTLNVPNADIGKHPVLASVGTDAVDADSGAVATAYWLKAPADRPDVVSPWTTVVQEHVQSLALTTAEAEAVVQSQGNLLVSPLSDYAAARSGDANAAVASRSARVLVLAMQQQLQALLPLAGQPDAGGASMSSADIHATVHQRLATMSSGATVAASQSAFTEACADPTSAGCAQAATTAATTLTGQALLKTATLPQFAQVRRLLADASTATGPSPTPTPGFNLDFVNAGDADNWYYRALITSTAGAVPDANGLVRYLDQRRSNVNGIITEFTGVNDPARQGDLHWDGSAWVGCQVGLEGTITVRDAGGLSRSNFCAGQNRNVNRRAFTDISGQPMADVAARIRATRAGSTNFALPPSWYSGSNPVSLGTATFPAGSQMLHQLNADVANAISYDVRSQGQVFMFSAETSAGGDARNGGTPACAIVANQNTVPTTDFETMVSRYKGTPCVFDQASFQEAGVQLTSLNPNEWTGQSTLSIGQIGSAPIGVTPRTAYYTTNTLMRMAFTGNGTNAVTYYSCRQRWNDGSPRNCTAIGTGSYAVAALGDARTMSFSNWPAQAGALTFQRVFVERQGAVYYGFQTKLSGGAYAIRLNGTAGNAMLTQLGMPAITVP